MQQGFTSQFEQLSRVLAQYRAYWQLLPFACQTLPWADDALQHRLALLDDTQLQQLEDDASVQQQYFAALFPALFALPAVLTPAASQAIAPVPFWLENGIGGRKLAQINALCQQWLPARLPVLEWCAGKGHLGRIVAQRFTQPVTSVEWQQLLCDEGTALAGKYQLAQQFVCTDVLTATQKPLLQSAQHVVALHACGQLHITMLRQVVAAGCQQLQLVPCCYHLIADTHYQPLSALAQQQDLRLGKDDLKLVVQGQVTGGERIARLRATEVLWRLAYDELRADLTGDKTYRPLASVAKQGFNADFAVFAHWAAAQHQLTLPAGVDWQQYLQRGASRAALVRRIELIRHLFRRPLELWLALDKALYLQQYGYSVSLTQLCDTAVTPRNVLLSATKAV